MGFIIFTYVPLFQKLVIINGIKIFTNVFSIIVSSTQRVQYTRSSSMYYCNPALSSSFFRYLFTILLYWRRHYSKIAEYSTLSSSAPTFDNPSFLPNSSTLSRTATSSNTASLHANLQEVSSPSLNNDESSTL